MSTGQYPKRRETDTQAQFRAEAIKQFNEANTTTQARPLSFHEALSLVDKKNYDRMHLQNAKRKRG